MDEEKRVSKNENIVLCILSMPASYVIAKYRFKGRKIMLSDSINLSFHAEVHCKRYDKWCSERIENQEEENERC